MWDTTQASSTVFNKDIFGIGRDDAQDLGQVKSRSMNTDGIITIEAGSEGSNTTPSFVDIADLEFLTIGNDNEDTTIGTWVDQNDSGFDDAPTGYQVQNRTWRVQELGDTGTTTIFRRHQRR
jgi:hypothetical protein